MVVFLLLVLVKVKGQFFWAIFIVLVEKSLLLIVIKTTLQHTLGPFVNSTAMMLLLYVNVSDHCVYYLTCVPL